ncbi:hypothetical protein J4219_04925 [Candidatus Woesearchaeota archaeon]|nr:hypothetical protein [Candidatus Woesearchaeota archaeon]
MVFGLFENPRSFEQWYGKFLGRGLFKTLNPARQVAWLAKNHPEWFFDFISAGKPLADNKDWVVQKVLSDILAYAGVFASNLSDLGSVPAISGWWRFNKGVWENKRDAVLALGAALSTYDRAYAFAKGLGENAPLFVCSIWAPVVGEDTFVRGLQNDGCRGFLDALSVEGVMRLGRNLTKFLKMLDEREVQKFAARFDKNTCFYLICPPQTPSGNDTDLFRTYTGFAEDLGSRLEAFARGLDFRVLRVLFSDMGDGFSDFLAGLGERVYLFGKGLGKEAASAGRGLGVKSKNLVAFFEGHEFIVTGLFRGLGGNRVLFAMGCLESISRLDPRLAQQAIARFESAPGFLEGLDAVSLREWERVKSHHVAVGGVTAPSLSVSPISFASKCLYCSDDLHEDDAVLECDKCHVVLHNSCAESHGNVCPTPGCQGRLYAVASKRAERSRQSLK